MNKFIKLIIICLFSIYLSGCQQTPELSNISDLSAVMSDTGVIISWTASKNANYYYIYRLQENHAGYTYWGVTEKTKIMDVSVMNEETYLYRVYPATKTDDGYKRGDVFLSTEEVFALKKPEIKAIKTYKEACRIEWETFSDSVEYFVYRKKEGDVNSTYVGKTNSGYLTDYNYDNQNIYLYAIEARVMHGEIYHKAMSNLIPAYPVPEILSAVRENSNTVLITWENKVAGAEYSVYRSLPDEGEYELLGVTDQTFYRDLTAYQRPKSLNNDIEMKVEDVEYYYKVKFDKRIDDTIIYSENSQKVALISE